MSGPHGKQDVRSETEMIQTREEEVSNELVRRSERLAIVGVRRGKGRPKKNWGG